MTSPAIKADEKALKAVRQTSTVSSNQQSDETTSMLPSSNTTQFHTSGFVSWLKVFRFCDLLMRQGC